MEKILVFDTSFASLNKGDNIIMECVNSELEYLYKDKFVLNLPTHLQPFSPFQVFRNSSRVRLYSNCELKFVGGSNLLIQDLLTHFPQWNFNFLNYKPLKGSILIAVGAGAGKKMNSYTKIMYKKVLNNNFFHSVRDERTKNILESIGIKAINTGCATMWMLTKEFCENIPSYKGDDVVFTMTAVPDVDKRDQELIDILTLEYKNIYFWPQGLGDLDYLNKFNNVRDIKILQANTKDFERILVRGNIDYVGTRLHAGIYAMRHSVRSIIIAIDERAREINRDTNLNCIEKDKLIELSELLNSEIKTKIDMPFDEIERWKRQF